MAVVIVVFELTGSGLQVGATVAFEIAPVLLLGFAAGAVMERLPRRTVMLVAELGRALIALGLVFGHGPSRRPLHVGVRAVGPVGVQLRQREHRYPARLRAPGETTAAAVGG